MRHHKGLNADNTAAAEIRGNACFLSKLTDARHMATSYEAAELRLLQSISRQSAYFPSKKARTVRVHTNHFEVLKGVRRHLFRAGRHLDARDAGVGVVRYHNRVVPGRARNGATVARLLLAPANPRLSLFSKLRWCLTQTASPRILRTVVCGPGATVCGVLGQPCAMSGWCLTQTASLRTRLTFAAGP